MGRYGWDNYMKLFSSIYNKVIAWSAHRHAPYYLAGVSFAESSFFPIPPDVMLLSMGLARPEATWRNAFIATIFSVIGGVLGYLIGAYGLHLLMPYIQSMGYYPSYLKTVEWFNHWGVWVVFLAGFSPIPYKLFTVSAGALSMPFLPFLFASLIGRGLRFYIVCALLYVFGDKLNNHLRQYIDIIGWSIVAIFVIVYLVIRYFS
jgi:membrane protein YqaA with SNARE-associated domain